MGLLSRPPGAKLSLHQDRNERDFSAPIVSVSFGLPLEARCHPLLGGCRINLTFRRAG